MRTLLTLGEDVVSSQLVSLLSVEDVISLRSTCRDIHKWLNTSAVWHVLFVKSFGNAPTPFLSSSYKWPELYKLRRKAKVFTWGKTAGGRLGYLIRDAPQTHVARTGMQPCICRPSEIKHLHDEVLADVTAGGFSFQILTSEGVLYHTGVNWNGGLKSGPGPLEDDQFPFPVDHLGFTHREGGGIRDAVGVMPMPFTGHRSAAVPPFPRTAANSNSFITKLEIFADSQTVHLVSISSGRCHFIALDSSNWIWTWDNPKQGKNGIKLQLGFANLIVKIAAGWNFSCCLVDKLGLVYWKSREPFRGNIEQQQSPTRAHCKVVPRIPNEEVIDMVALDNCLVFITDTGRIYRFDLDGSRPYPLVSFNSWLNSHSEQTTPKFVRLSGSFKNFSAISDDGFVLIGHKEIDSPSVVKALQQKNVINVQFGDYHQLALTKDGELFSWGRESQFCGCLGLGDRESLQMREGGRVEGSAVCFKAPQKVETNGKCLAICAGGWQSCAVVAED